MLDEDEFNEVDERMYHCIRCRERSKPIEAQKRHLLVSRRKAIHPLTR